MDAEQKPQIEEKRIPRPPNAFMIFGQRHRRILAQQYPELTNKQISKILGTEWREMRTEDKDHFHKLAEEAYQNHMKMYPNYYYSPLEARQRKAERKKKYLLRCGRRNEQQIRGNGETMHPQPDFGEEMIAIHTIPQREADSSFNDLQLIPVICHHPIHSGNQTLFSFSLAPIEQFAPPVQFPVTEEEAAVRHMIGDVGLPPEPPTIYHVSHKDPNLGQSAEFEQPRGMNSLGDSTPKEPPFSELVYNNFLPPMENSAVSVTEVNHMRETVIATIGHPSKPKVIVKKEPVDDNNDPYLFSRVVDVLSAE